MLKKPAVILHIVMLIVLVSMAFGALFTHFFDPLLPGGRSYLYSGVLLIYAIWRAVRLKRFLEQEKEPEQ